MNIVNINKENIMKTVIVGLSGGVDSSVSACLLKQQGYNVIGIHMRGANLETQQEDEKRVRELCNELGIECVVVDYKDHMQQVKDYFVSEYLAGRTPNPCVVCNKEVKFKPFIEYMNKLGADYFATGHYAIIEHTPSGHYLKKAVDIVKDQTYFLCQLTPEQIEKVLFPLGDLTKAEVRKIAEENNLITKETKESYDVCFLGSQKFKDFMAENYPEKAGNIVDKRTNTIVGKHTGISKYTIGQRRGLNIGGKDGYGLNRWFVVDKDIKTNTLYVSRGECEEMFSSGCMVTDFNWITKPSENKFECGVKLRYRQPDQQTQVEVLDEKNIRLTFKEKQRAVTIGQFAVLYDENGLCLGGGRILEIFQFT